MSRFLAVAALAAIVACGPGAVDRAALTVPEPDTSQLEPSLAEWLLGVRDDVRAKVANPQISRQDLAVRFGDYGQVLHAFDLRETAIEAYRQAEYLDPNDFRWPYLAARLKAFLGDFEGAREDFERALELDSSATHAWVGLGDAERASGDLEGAMAIYRHSLELETSAAAQFGLGQAQLAAEEFEAAAQSFERALELQPQASAIYAPLAQALRGAGRVEEAELALARRGRHSVELEDPTTKGVGDVRILGAYQALLSMAAADELTADELLGFTLTRLGDVEGSVEVLANDLDKLEQEDREGNRRQRARLHYALGGLRVYLEDDAAAEVNFARSLELDPRLDPARIKLGNLLARRGAFSEAVEYYDHVLEGDADNVEALLKRGTALLNLRRLESAVADLNRVLVLDPAEPLAHVRLAEALEVGGDPGAAEQRLLRASENEALNARGRALVLRSLGDHLLRRQRLTEASTVLEQALDEDRTLTSARMRLADVLATLERYDAALAQFDQVVADQPSNVVAHLHRAGVWLLKGDWEQAVAGLEVALRLNPSDLAIAHQLARVLAAVPQVRDPQRALTLATQVYEQRRTGSTAITMGMALAGVARFEDAIEIESRVRSGPLQQKRLTAYRQRRAYDSEDPGELLVMPR